VKSPPKNFGFSDLLIILINNKMTRRDRYFAEFGIILFGIIGLSILLMSLGLWHLLLILWRLL
jgi:hypothetical protein